MPEAGMFILKEILRLERIFMSKQPHSDPVYLPYAGTQLMSTPLLNKGTAFTEKERLDFNLLGLVPPRCESLAEQTDRAYRQYRSFDRPINQHIYLRHIQDTNETLYYSLLSAHLEEMLPVVYTPTVGEACQRFSEIYRRPRGLFISYPDRDRIDEILHNATKRKVKVIVVTDGSRILGLGDLGAGGMGIPIGKLALYTACGGISPAYTLPIMLDAGTDNPQLLDDPQYIGWQHPRIDSAEYDAFVEQFIEAVKKRWPNVLLQFEDFEQRKALPLLERYQRQICCFNDDIQGTAAVAAATLLAACHHKDQPLSAQKIVFVGAGSAGCGIAEQLGRHMQQEGLTDAEARRRIFMVDRDGLLVGDTPSMLDFQQRLAQSTEDLPAALPLNADLGAVITHIHPTILIGVSGQPDLFDEALIREMYKHCSQPVIFPLSNPSSRVEAKPADILAWTEGKALVATGSPFAAVDFNGEHYPIAQCNNSYIFPGLGLAVIAGRIDFISDALLLTASETLAALSPMAQDNDGALLPALSESAEISRAIAFAVIKTAQEIGLAEACDDETIQRRIDENFWQPHYREYRRVSL